MAETTAIEWTDATWNPWIGCQKVSQGCKHCYMFRDQQRYGNDPTQVRQTSPATFRSPLKWKDPKVIFTCSWSDFFIDEADAWRDSAWEIIRQTPHHTYQILTKRPERILTNLPLDWGDGYPNVWIGVTVEDQAAADKRIPLLLEVPAAVHFLSCEPLLGPVDLGRFLPTERYYVAKCGACGFIASSERFIEHSNGDDADVLCPACYSSKTDETSGIDWVIAGGESGLYARPMHPDWARTLRDQCQAAGVAFLFKQWGEWGPAPHRVAASDQPGDTVEERKRQAEALGATHSYAAWAHMHGHQPREMTHKPWSIERTDLPPGQASMRHWGKKNAGRELDGRTWDEFPRPRR